MSTGVLRSTWLWLLLLAACLKPPVTLEVLYVTPDHGRVALGDSVHFVATGLRSDGTTALMTDQVAWLVDDVLVAKVDATSPGTVQGVGLGSTVVRAVRDGVVASRPLTVTESTLRLLQVYPPRPVAPLGLGVQLQVIAVHTDQTIENVTAQAVYMPGDASLFSASGGKLLGKAPGSGDLAVSWQGRVVHVPVTVTSASVLRLEVQPGEVTLPVGIAQQLAATASLTDGSTLDVTEGVAWTSSAPNTAAVSTGAGTTPGQVTGRAVGDATVTAALGTVRAAALVHVSGAVLSSVVVAPPAPSAPAGTTTELTATAIFSDFSSHDVTGQVTWSATPPDVAVPVASVPGRVKGLRQGTAQVRAGLLGVTGIATLTVSTALLTGLAVTPPAQTLAAGTSFPFTATGTYSDLSAHDVSDQVVWTVADAGVATVSNAPGSQGQVLALGPGATQVAAELGTSRGTATLTVTSATLSRLQVTWAPPVPTGGLPVGVSHQLVATGVFSDRSTQDLTDQVTWSATAPGVVSVSNVAGSRGRVQGIGQGQTTVQATFGTVSGALPVTVSPAVLASLSLRPSPLGVVLTTRAQLTAIGLLSDASQPDLTSQVTWTSLAPGVASVSTAGEVQGLTVGSTVVRAQLGSVWATVPVTVRAASLVSIEVTPRDPTLAAGFTQAFRARGTWDDATTQDLTTQVSWTSGAPTVASISNATADVGVATAAGAGTSTIGAALLGVSGSTTLTVTDAVLTALSVSPPALSLSRKATGALTVRGTYSDHSSLDLTREATWVSSAAGVVSVSSAGGTEGTVVGEEVGSAEVSASMPTDGGFLSSSAHVTVTPAFLVGLVVEPHLTSAPLGSQVPFTVHGVSSDGTSPDLTSSAAWSSSDQTVATVSSSGPSAGVATALQGGVTTVTARVPSPDGGSVPLQDSATLTVTAATLASIAISPAPPATSLQLAMNTSLPLRATGRWTDGTTQDLTGQVTWASEDETLAQVSNTAPTRGVVSGRSPTQASVGVGVTATLGLKSSRAVLTVTSAHLTSIALTGSTLSAALGYSVQLTATGTFDDSTTQDLTGQAAWASSDSTLVSVTPGGLATAVKVGSPDLSATFLGVSGHVTFNATAAVLLSLALNPTSATVPIGIPQPFIAQGTFSDTSTRDVTDSVTWGSSDPRVATVSNSPGTYGVATGSSVGQVTLTATPPPGSSAAPVHATLTVSPAVLLSLSVTPAAPSVAAGLDQAFTAWGTYSDSPTAIDVTELATWTSDAPAVADVSGAPGSRGRATTKQKGEATITAALGGKQDSATLTVTDATLVSVGVTPVNASLPLGLSLQFLLTGVYTDGSSQDLTELAAWDTTDHARATISSAPGSRGLAQADTANTGTVTIQASYPGQPVATTQLTISGAVLQAVQVTAPGGDASTPAGVPLQLTATGLYSNGTNRDLTSSVTWSSDTLAVATVSNFSGSQGLVTALAEGTATLSAAKDGHSGSLLVTVTAAVLRTVQVSPANATLPKGLTQAFTATGLYSAGPSRDLTPSVVWSAVPAVPPGAVSFSPVPGSQGVASADTVGKVTVWATLGTVSGSAPFEVTSAILTSVTLSPANANVPLGSVRQLTATGHYSDGSTRNLNNDPLTSWWTSDSLKVSISNATGSKGLASTLGVGTVTVYATASGFTVSTSMTVTQATLSSIDVTPASGSTALGYTRQFTASGNYSDGTTSVLTTLVTWSSNRPDLALLSNAGGSKGLLTPVATGTLDVSATLGTVVGSTPHTISPAQLLDLVVTPTDPTVAVGPTHTLQLTATGSFSDGTGQDLTADGTLTWSSSDPTVAQVDNAGATRGLVTGIKSGTTTITATRGTRVGSTVVTVP